jgi:hypothetical protein
MLNIVLYIHSYSYFLKKIHFYAFLAYSVRSVVQGCAGDRGSRLRGPSTRLRRVL